ncbi:MAG: outer membrane protein assembly factor BamA [Nevskiales bacterium]|nr:outer membrane protein assembly factor BamA [Nevskiales bacterium]
MNARSLRWGVLLALCCVARAMAFEPFTIAEIRTQGLQRLEIGTVLSYLPLSTGDRLTDQTARQAIRALYASGLFQDVELLRDGRVLVVNVIERPAISSFTIEGNEKIGGDELNESLRQLGLASGEPFRHALLDRVEQELRRQYYASGYYDVALATEVTEEPNNRVSLKITVTEGKVTRIRDINIIGNRTFSRSQLREQIRLDTPRWWVPFQRSDRYSKQQLFGDLETLTSYYQDRGHLKFNISSVQVALSPDKESIYITLNLEEGEVYTVKDHRFSGDLFLQPDFLNSLVSTAAGSVFSRKQATESANRIEAALADAGYAFARVTPLPEVDETRHEVRLNYFVEPGRRSYVRRINFSGNTGTHDETLRREMRQLEAAPFSKSDVERSRVRLARLPFIENVEVETRPVPGSDDLVDIQFTVKERPAGSVQFGFGYSGSSGFQVTGSVTHTNAFGTGNSVSAEVNSDEIARRFSLNWQDPYFTEDGISRSWSVFYTELDGLSIVSSSTFSLNVMGGSLTYGIPLSEFATLRAGVSVEDTALTTFPESTASILQFALENGTRYLTWELRTGLAWDTRNRTIFADHGTLNRLDLDFVLPGSDLQYYRAIYRYQHYVPFAFDTILELNGRLGVLDRYGSGDPPPYENFQAGGPRSVRGYRASTLGPSEPSAIAGEGPVAIGGRFLATSQAELIIPLPFESDGKSTRTSLFYDVGNVFARPGDFSFAELRQSAGVAFTWHTPFLGILDLSFAVPLDDQPEDRTDTFQINFGTPF